MIDVFVVTSLAVFTVTYMLREQFGPGNILEKFRSKFVGIVAMPVYNSDEEIESYIFEVNTPDKFITKLFLCHWCLSMWISIIFSIGIVLITFVNCSLAECLFQFISFSFGMTGVSGILYLTIGKLS